MSGIGLRYGLAVCVIGLALLAHAAPPPGDACESLSVHVKNGDALRDVCLWAASAPKRLPDLLVEQFTTREIQAARQQGWTKLDEITCSLRYEHGSVDYLNVMLDGKPVGPSGVPGQWTTGEYAAILASILQPDQDPHFDFVQRTKQKGQELLEFHFQVKRQKNRTFTMRVLSRQEQPGFEGSVWIDAQTHRLVALRRRTDDVNVSFPVSYVGTVIQYSPIDLADGSTVVLPTHSIEYSCDRGNTCRRNTIRFENWRKFGASHRIGVEGEASAESPQQ